jgi:hypothetical protein
MTPRRTSAAVFFFAGVVGLAGCAATGAPSAGAAPSTSAEAGLGGPAASPSPSPTSAATKTKTKTETKTKTKSSRTKKASTTKTTSTPTSSGPRIVSFKVAQQPRCAEGTAVFRAAAVPLIIEWTIAGATGGELSVDDPTGTPGTYGSVGLRGSMEFTFGCNGDIGTTETHTYALYTVGGGPQRSKTISASAKVLDHGTATPAPN